MCDGLPGRPRAPTPEIVATMSDMVEIARGQGFTAIKCPSSASRKCPTGRLSICSARCVNS